MAETYDVVVVGGGFAGLSSALSAAREGLKVCVLEKNREIGQNIKTTGIFLKPVMDEFSIPRELVINNMRELEIFSPSGRSLKIRTKQPKYFITDTAATLKWLAEECESAGCRIKTGVKVGGLKFSGDGVNLGGVRSGAIALACGNDVQLAGKVSGTTPERFLVGMELIADGVDLEDDSAIQAFFDYNLAPGYGGWIVPYGKRRAAVGLARYHPCGTDMEKLVLGYFRKTLKKGFRIVEKRAGLIPISGPVSKTYGERFVVVGGAAGQVGSMSAAGIHHAMNIGKIAGEVLAGSIDDPSEGNLRQYEAAWKKRYSKPLSYDLFMRRLLEKFDSNKKIEDLLDILSEKVFLKNLERAMDKTRIKSLDMAQALLGLLLTEPKGFVKFVSNVVR